MARTKTFTEFCRAGKTTPEEEEKLWVYLLFCRFYKAARERPPRVEHGTNTAIQTEAP